MNQFMLDFVWPLFLLAIAICFWWVKRDQFRLVDVPFALRVLILALGIGVNAFVVFLWIMSPADGQRSFLVQLATIPALYVGITGKMPERRPKN